MNRLVGFDRTIVHNQPGTTRDVVTIPTAFEGWPVVLSDTAGVRNSHDVIEQKGVSRAIAESEKADLVLELIDQSVLPTLVEQDRLKNCSTKTIFVATKIDLGNDWKENLPAGTIPVSSLTGEGIDHLISAIVERLIPKIPAPHTAIPITPRQVELLLKEQQAVL